MNVKAKVDVSKYQLSTYPASYTLQAPTAGFTQTYTSHMY